MSMNFKRVFGETKPVIGMVHIGALPGSPLFDPALDLVASARADLLALQKAGFDAVMFGNENDRPYEFDVDTASTATMAVIIGQLKSEITVPFGVNVLWDPMSSIALGVATGAALCVKFLRALMRLTWVHGHQMRDALCAIAIGWGAPTWLRFTMFAPNLHILLINAPYLTVHAAQCFRRSRMPSLCPVKLLARRRPFQI